jgi:hypothetical protein
MTRFITTDDLRTLKELHLGNNVAGTSPMFGETRLLRVIPEAVSDAALSTLVANIA